MPVLDNAQHEAFAHHIAKGMPGSTAYEKAGYSTKGNSSEAAASRLLRDVKVAARIAELQNMAAERVVVDREWVLAKLIENATNNQEGNPAASNKALELIGKELGMFVERTENLNTNYNISDEPMSDDEWAEQHATAH